MQPYTRADTHIKYPMFPSVLKSHQVTSVGEPNHEVLPKRFCSVPDPAIYYVLTDDKWHHRDLTSYLKNSSLT
jgi:hypothetical protein